MPRAVILPNGMERKMALFDVFSDDLDEEVMSLTSAMLSYVSDDSVVGVLQNGGGAGGEENQNAVPSLSVTDMDGVNLLVKRSTDNMVVAFCKEGEEGKPPSHDVIMTSSFR